MALCSTVGATEEEEEEEEEEEDDDAEDELSFLIELFLVPPERDPVFCFNSCLTRAAISAVNAPSI
jgi:hypothetical protein